jgi:phosphate/sulfate permease
MDHTAELTGKTIGAAGGAVFGLITWNQIADTVLLTFIGSVIGGVTGFTVTWFMQKLFKRSK